MPFRKPTALVRPRHDDDREDRLGRGRGGTEEVTSTG
jgi:hypothetical protein